METFADDVSTPLLTGLFEAVSKHASVALLIGLIAFVLAIAGYALIMYLLRRKLVKTKQKNHLNLP